MKTILNNMTISEIQDIVRDAELKGWHRGMTEAAEIAGLHPKGYTVNDWTDYTRGRNDAQGHILAARNAKTNTTPQPQPQPDNREE